jgi:hypothetical protein
MAMNLYEALYPDAQKDLEPHGFVDLVSVKAVPDPDRPEDRLAMK